MSRNRNIFDVIVPPMRQYLLETFKTTGVLPFVTIELVPAVYDDLMCEMIERGFYRYPVDGRAIPMKPPHSLVIHEGIVLRRGEQ